MLNSLTLWLRNLAYKNRTCTTPGNQLQLAVSAARRAKKLTIKLKGHNNRLVIGEHAELSHCEIRLDGTDNLIEIGPRVRYSGKIYLKATHGQHIRIGADTTVEGAYLLVDEAASIDIGQDCMLSTNIIVRTGDKHSIIDPHTRQRLNPARAIHIHDRVWIGRSVQILKGTVLKAESVVGTGSVVTRAFEEGHCVVAGMPARIVRRGVSWDRALL